MFLMTSAAAVVVAYIRFDWFKIGGACPAGFHARFRPLPLYPPPEEEQAPNRARYRRVERRVAEERDYRGVIYHGGYNGEKGRAG